jgi:hypothetical protein
LDRIVTPLLTARRSLGTTAIRIGVLAFALVLGSPAAALAASPSPNPPSSNSGKGAAPSTASPKAVYGLGPASATGVDGRPRFKWSASPGGTLQDHVAVLNIGTTPLILDLYARDAVNQPDGSLGLQTKATKPTDAGSWITLEIPHGASTVSVPARSTVIVPVSLVVPRNASPGDHTGGIIVSLTAESTSTGKQVVAPNLEQRVAVPVAIRISGPLQPKLSVQSLSASYGQTLNPVGGGHATITYKVVNTGNVNLGGHEAVAISGLFGSTVHAKAPDVPVLLPGNSILESVPVHGVLPEFLMSARVTVTPLAASGDVDPGLIATRGSKHFWAVPWLLLGIIALLLLGWRQLRRRKRPSTGRHGTRSGGGTRRRGTVVASDSARLPAHGARGGVRVKSGLARMAAGFAAIIFATVSALAVRESTAYASARLPYTDTYAHGYVGLCDKNGNNITHGSVYDKPFVWRAVSSVPAPLSFAGDGRKATLYAMQPRQGTDPMAWSGDSLTASSTYANTAVPIAQATDRDFALSDFLNEFAPQWDRLLELRIYFSAPEQGVDANTYPATDIRISGTTWSLVSGGKVNCNGGDATSPEQLLPSSNPAGLGPPSVLGVVAAKAVGAPPPKTTAGTSGSSTAGSSVAVGQSQPPGTSDASQISQAGLDSRTTQGSGHIFVIVVVAVVCLLGSGVVLWRRGRSRVV